MKTLESFLTAYLANRPFFMSLIRAKEAYLFSRYASIIGTSLDIGCGDGFFADTAFGHVDIGLDVKESRINEAKKRGYRRLVTYEGTKMPFSSNTISTCVSNCVLEHIPDVSTTVKEAFRVLKHGGHFYTSVMAAPWETYLFGALFFGDRYRQFMNRTQVHRNLYTDSRWRKLFTESGFTIVRDIGYLTPAQCRLIDFGHYISVPSLATYMTLGSWVPIPELTRLYPRKQLAAYMEPCIKPSLSGALWFDLLKP